MIQCDQCDYDDDDDDDIGQVPYCLVLSCPVRLFLAAGCLLDSDSEQYPVMRLDYSYILSRYCVVPRVRQ